MDGWAKTIKHPPLHGHTPRISLCTLNHRGAMRNARQIGIDRMIRLSPGLAGATIVRMQGAPTEAPSRKQAPNRTPAETLEVSP